MNFNKVQQRLINVMSLFLPAGKIKPLRLLVIVGISAITNFDL